VKFLIDNQLPTALTKFLRDAGHDAVHVHDLGIGAADDSEVWRRALAEGRALVSKDDDFLHRANHHDGGALFVWIRLGNCRNQELLAAFARILPDLESLAAHSPRVIEIR